MDEEIHLFSSGLSYSLYVQYKIYPVASKDFHHQLMHWQFHLISHALFFYCVERNEEENIKKKLKMNDDLERPSCI